MSAPTPRHDMPALPPAPSLAPFLPPDRAHGGRESSAGVGLLRRFPLAPAEGWLTIGLILLLVLPVAWSITDARWVLGRADLTAFLPFTVIGGVAWGSFAAKAGWGRWRTHFLGAVVAALVIPILVGSAIEPKAGSIGGFFLATASSSVDAVLDLTVRNRTVTQQFGHYLLVLGILTWATAQFASYAALGHRRPLGAVFVTGLVLLTNMAITVNDQLQFLVIFSFAALLLLVRLHADEERLSWLHRRIGDPAAVTSLYLRGGATLVAVAIVGALALTTTASSAPLAAAFSDVDNKLVDFGQQIQRYLPFGGPGTKLSGVSFGPNATIGSLWVTDTTPALEITVPVGDTTPHYWAAYTYDKFDQEAWSISDNTRVGVDPGSPILDGTADQVPSPQLRETLDFSVRNLSFGGSQIFMPDAPQTVNIAANATFLGNTRYFSSLETNGGWSSYTATALIPKPATATTVGFTQNELRAASTVYPPEIVQYYLAKETLGTGSSKILAEIKAKAVKEDPAGVGTDPYDLALGAVDVLQSKEFTYTTDVTTLATGACSTLSIVECFSEYKQGFCQWYATTMAILLRDAGVPTRFVQGWLPGTRDPKTGVETILRSNSHAWVEVYFPGYGWYPFDPTGNGQAQPTALLPGPKVSPAPVATTRPRASGDSGVDRTIRPPVLTGTTAPPPSSGSSSGAFIVVAILLLVAVGGIAFAAYRRGPRGPTRPDTVWDGVIGLAGRFGWAPRPTQTPYEYAGALGDVLPVARSDLHVVASAKVEVAYGRRVLDDDRLDSLRAAQRRLRVVLLRLIFRRPKRPRIRLR
jgi:transglutaminase-like putative cysteine protease